MQGILKSNHQKLCECLQDVKEMGPVADSNLSELEKELQAVFLSYQEKMKELKRLVIIYEEKQKTIKNEIKKVKKHNSLLDSKKVSSFALGKVVNLILPALQYLVIFNAV